VIRRPIERIFSLNSWMRRHDRKRRDVAVLIAANVRDGYEVPRRDVAEFALHSRAYTALLDVAVRESRRLSR